MEQIRPRSALSGVSTLSLAVVESRDAPDPLEDLVVAAVRVDRADVLAGIVARYLSCKAAPVASYISCRWLRRF